MAQYQGRIAKLADKDNNTVVPITNARAVEVSKNRNLEAIVDKVDDMENVAQRVFNNSITPIITPIQTSVQRLDGIEAKANANTTKVNQLEQKQTSDKNEVTNTLNGVKQSVQTIEGNVTNTSNTVTQHTQQIADLEYSVGEALPKAEEAVAKVDGILGEKYIDCIAQGKMTQVGKQADGQVVAIDNSFAKSAMFKGQTLVNLIIDKRAVLDTRNNDYTLTSVKPSTKYLAIFNIDTDATSIVCGILKSGTEWNTAPVSVINGINKCIITTTSDTSTGFRVRYGDSATPTKFETSNVMLFEYQDGMENWDIPYFEGMQSTKSPVLTTTGKNYIDAEKMQLGFLSDGDKINPHDFWVYTPQHLKIKSGTYYIKSDIFNSKKRIGLYDKNKSFIKVIEVPISNTTLAIPSGVEYIRISCSKYPEVAPTQEEIDNPKIIISDTATTYEPYKTNILSTPEDVILRSLPNGVCDTLNLLTGEYVQRIGEVVLDGKGINLYHSEEREETNRFRTDINYIKNKYYADGLGIICNKFISLSEVQAMDNVTIGCWVGNNGAIHLKLSKTLFPTKDVEVLRTYLQANPVTVQYELAIPIVKKVKLSNSPFMFKDGHIILSSANDLLPSLTYTATVGIKGQVETLSNTVSNIKIEDGVVAPSPNTLARRNNEGNIYAKDKFIFEDGKAIKVNAERIQWGNTADWHNIHDNQSLPVEKGTFMPRLVGEGGGVSRDYNAQEGSYQRIGNLVHIQLRIEVNDWYSCQGSFQIAGLPFASNNTYSSFAFGWASNLQTDLDNASLSAYMRPNTSGIALGFNEIKDGSRYYPIQNPNVGDRDSSLDIAIAGTYMID